MFFFLSKILVFLISPLTWIFTLLAFALFTKNPVRKKRLFIISLASLYFFSNSFIADEAMRAWEVTTPDLKPTEKYEYAVVLGGMLWYDARQDKPQFMRGSDRIFQTLPLFRNGQIKKLLLTGGSGSISHPEERESDILKNYLVKTGIPDSCIITENDSRNTRENALFTKRVMDSLHVKGDVLFVTSAFHMRRAIGCFEKVGITNIVPYPTDRYSGPRKYELDFMFLPCTDALDQWNLLIHEWVGYITYKVKGFC